MKIWQIETTFKLKVLRLKNRLEFWLELILYYRSANKKTFAQGLVWEGMHKFAQWKKMFAHLLTHKEKQENWRMALLLLHHFINAMWIDWPNTIAFHLAFSVPKVQGPIICYCSALASFLV